MASLLTSSGMISLLPNLAMALRLVGEFFPLELIENTFLVLGLEPINDPACGVTLEILHDLGKIGAPWQSSGGDSLG